jgi:hypothetical protein
LETNANAPVKFNANDTEADQPKIKREVDNASSMLGK